MVQVVEVIIYVMQGPISYIINTMYQMTWQWLGANGIISHDFDIILRE